MRVAKGGVNIPSDLLMVQLQPRKKKNLSSQSSFTSAKLIYVLLSLSVEFL